MRVIGLVLFAAVFALTLTVAANVSPVRLPELPDPPTPRAYHLQMADPERFLSSPPFKGCGDLWNQILEIQDSCDSDVTCVKV